MQIEESRNRKDKHVIYSWHVYNNEFSGLLQNTITLIQRIKRKIWKRKSCKAHEQDY